MLQHEVDNLLICCVNNVNTVVITRVVTTSTNRGYNIRVYEIEQAYQSQQRARAERR